MSLDQQNPYSGMKHIKTEHHNDLDAFAHRSEPKSSLMPGTQGESANYPKNDRSELAMLGVPKYHQNEQNSSLRRRQVRQSKPDIEMTNGSSASWPPIGNKASVQPLPTNGDSSYETASTNTLEQVALDKTYRPTNNVNKFEILQRLGAEMESLRQDHSARLRKVHELETKVADGETECGSMIQTYLELGRAIETRKKHLYEDKWTLSKELSCKDDIMSRMNQMITQMNALMFEMNNDPRPGGNVFETTDGDSGI